MTTLAEVMAENDAIADVEMRAVEREQAAWITGSKMHRREAERLHRFARYLLTGEVDAPASVGGLGGAL
jgi:hypothetical protein